MRTTSTDEAVLTTAEAEATVCLEPSSWERLAFLCEVGKDLMDPETRAQLVVRQLHQALENGLPLRQPNAAADHQPESVDTSLAARGKELAEYLLLTERGIALAHFLPYPLFRPYMPYLNAFDRAIQDDPGARPELEQLIGTLPAAEPENHMGTLLGGQSPWGGKPIRGCYAISLFANRIGLLEKPYYREGLVEKLAQRMLELEQKPENVSCFLDIAELHKFTLHEMQQIFRDVVQKLLEGSLDREPGITYLATLQEAVLPEKRLAELGYPATLLQDLAENAAASLCQNASYLVTETERRQYVEGLDTRGARLGFEQLGTDTVVRRLVAAVSRVDWGELHVFGYLGADLNLGAQPDVMQKITAARPPLEHILELAGQRALSDLAYLQRTMSFLLDDVPETVNRQYLYTLADSPDFVHGVRHYVETLQADDLYGGEPIRLLTFLRDAPQPELNGLMRAPNLRTACEGWARKTASKDHNDVAERRQLVKECEGLLGTSFGQLEYPVRDKQ